MSATSQTHVTEDITLTHRAQAPNTTIISYEDTQQSINYTTEKDPIINANKGQKYHSI